MRTRFFLATPHRVPDQATAGQAGLRQCLVVQFVRRNHRPQPLDAAVVADVLGLQHEPARIQFRRQDLLQCLAVLVLARAVDGGQQCQLVEKVQFQLRRRVGDHRLRLCDRLLDVAPAPGHVLRQRILRAENPQHVVAAADLPQPRAWLLAGNQHGFERCRIGGRYRCRRRRRCNRRFILGHGCGGSERQAGNEKE
jgi:hypothetical protein